MKKLLFVAVLVIAFASAALSQPFGKGYHGINAGIGLGNGYYTASAYSFGFGINGSYEYGIVEIPMGSSLTGVVGIGGTAGLSWSNYAYSYWDGKYHYTNWAMAARGTYHFIFDNDKVDPYAGLTLGYQGSAYKWKGNGQAPDYHGSSGYFRVGAFVGCRYLFMENFGVFGELGWQLNFMNLGVCWIINK